VLRAWIQPKPSAPTNDAAPRSIPFEPPGSSVFPFPGGIVVIFALALAVNALDRNVFAALQPALENKFRLTNAQYGYLVAGFSISYGVSAPIMGLLLNLASQGLR
jgi:hypothetical protein